ncbi:MAG: hypothetical protein EBY80_12560, partial [Actinobacteria bacterium]|nr:hypothetical protein [Actinomycetota bacterium]
LKSGSVVALEETGALIRRFSAARLALRLSGAELPESLRALCVQFNGGPVGLTTLAIGVGEQPETVEDVYEPFLIQLGLIARTPRGRVAMPAAWNHLGLEVPSNQPDLFS